MTVSSGYENKGYDGDNPVKVCSKINKFFIFINFDHFLPDRKTILCQYKSIYFYHFVFNSFIHIHIASIEKYRGYCIDKRKSKIIAVGKMEDIEKRVHFIVSFYDSIYSVSGNLHIFFIDFIAIDICYSCFFAFCYFFSLFIFNTM